MTSRKIAKCALLIILGMLIMYLWLWGNGAIKVEAAAIAVEPIGGTKRELIEGGGMPCMGADHEQETSKEEVQEAVYDRDNTDYESRVTYYTVNGKRLGENLEAYLYGQLKQRWIEHFYELALCQIYQESRFNCSAVNSVHMDFGLCQHCQGSFPTSAKEAGLVEYDIMNPIDSIYVYAYLMEKYLREEGSVDMALSRYYTGHSVYNDQYVKDVTRWINTMEEINTGKTV